MKAVRSMATVGRTVAMVITIISNQILELVNTIFRLGSISLGFFGPILITSRFGLKFRDPDLLLAIGFGEQSYIRYVPPAIIQILQNFSDLSAFDCGHNSPI